MSEPVYVQAGSWREAVQWAQSQQILPRDLRYLYDARLLVGAAPGITIHRVGRWRHHEAVIDIETQARFRGAKVVEHP